MQNIAQHWDTVYENKSVEQLGWYEAQSEYGLSFIKECVPNTKERIFLAGVGRSTLVHELLENRYNNLILNDISSIALEKLRIDLAESMSPSIIWHQADLGQKIPSNTPPNDFPKVTLWYDRAVLHFLMTEAERQNYFELLRQKVQLDGWVILAQFAKNGVQKCSNLSVFRYNNELFLELLGTDFQLQKSKEVLYHTPSGDERPYIYSIFQRQAISN